MEAPVAHGFAVGFGVAQSAGVRSVKTPVQAGNAVGFGFAPFAVPGPVTLELLPGFAAAGVVHPLVGGAAGEDVALNQLPVLLLGVPDQRLHIFLRRLEPALRGERVGQRGEAVAGNLPAAELARQPDR